MTALPPRPKKTAIENIEEEFLPEEEFLSEKTLLEMEAGRRGVEASKNKLNLELEAGKKAMEKTRRRLGLTKNSDE